MNINCYDSFNEGMTPVYKNDNWMIGIKNFKPANAIENLDSMERHNETDEQFVLLEGECTLIYANEEGGELHIEALVMQKGKVYSIPAKLWHNTITIPSTKMVLIEAQNTSMDNSNVLTLTDVQRKKVKDLVRI